MNDTPIIIYTDGSCNPSYELGAWAAILFIHGNKIQISGSEQQTTHQRMELQAVIKSFEYLAHENLYQHQLEVYTDSQYVVGLPTRNRKLKQSGFMTSKGRPIQNADLVQMLIGHMEKMNVTFVKVKAHQKGNENVNREVDKLSRKMVRDLVDRIKD